MIDISKQVLGFSLGSLPVIGTVLHFAGVLGPVIDTLQATSSFWYPAIAVGMTQVAPAVPAIPSGTAQTVLVATSTLFVGLKLVAGYEYFFGDET